MYKVMSHPASYSTASQAIDKAFELFPLDLHGKKVLIKPNVLRAAKPEEAIATNPAILRAVVAKVESLGPASIVVGDNPGLFNYGANEDAFIKTGLMEAAGRYYKNIGNDSRQVDFNKNYMPAVSVSQAVLDADVIISLPKFKTHGLTVVTGAIKNCYGFLPGAQKAKLHRIAGNAERFHDVIVDVFRIRIPDLFIVDAVVGMEGNGPASPDLREIGLVLASDNAVALDGVIAAMMGCDPGGLRFLQKASEAGLGSYDLENIEVIGELKRLPNFKIPHAGGDAILRNETMQNLLHKRSAQRPQADPALCTSCGTCVEQCPVSALRIDDSIPVVDPEICIACFCCQEICPEKAITLK